MKYKCCPTRIYNMDERSTYYNRPRFKESNWSQRTNRIGSVNSWERGKNTINFYTLFISPRKRMDMKLAKNGPSVAVYECIKNGWTTHENFMNWLKQYHTNHTKENPVS